MTISNPQILGTANGSPVIAELSAGVGANDIHVRVTLTADYTMLDPGGFPERPPAGDSSYVNKGLPRTITSGATVSFLKPEAAALVAAGAAVFA